MTYDIEVKELPARYVASIRVTVAPDQMGPTFEELLPEVLAELQEQNAQASGPSFGIFFEFGEQVDMEAGFPVMLPVESSGRVGFRTLEEGTFAVTWHHGPYSTIGEAHRAVTQWAEQNGRAILGPPWEVYWDGPASGKPAAEFRTEVGYPIG
ncbi:MAG TPA: GyrI-like domain-containing protein [Actinomycetota bacterium]|nr:GyrI-like domain-containing protein [Actinomycetota bacterium]